MSKVIVGIVAKYRDGDENQKIVDSRIRNEIKQAVFDNGGIAIGIISPNNEIQPAGDDWMKYNDLIDINDLIISMCEQHMLNIDYNDYIITVTRAYISNGRAYEKKEEFEQAYNSYLRVVEIQKKQEDKDLYAIRRIYFSKDLS